MGSQHLVSLAVLACCVQAGQQARTANETYPEGFCYASSCDPDAPLSGQAIDLSESLRANSWHEGQWINAELWQTTADFADGVAMPTSIDKLICLM